jgi:uncharacterized membrane protein (UPF0127 family)
MNNTLEQISEDDLAHVISHTMEIFEQDMKGKTLRFMEDGSLFVFEAGTDVALRYNNLMHYLEVVYMRQEGN